MRITSQMFQLIAHRALRERGAALAQAELEAATGRRVRTMSDAPLDAAQLVRMSGELGELEQYRRNGSFAGARMAAEDAVIEATRELLSRARDLARTAAAADPADPIRQAAIDEVLRIREQLVALGNTKVGNDYVLAGSRSDTPPFLADGTYVGDSLEREIDLDHGLRIGTNHTGDAFMTDALQAVAALELELRFGTPATIEGTWDALDAADRTALAVQTDLGARLGQIEDTSRALARRASALADRRDAIRDVDPAESLLKIAAAQTALERAYAAIGRTLDLTLVDHLR